MGKSQRDKGNRGERELVKILKKAGFEDATRNYADKVDRNGVDVEAANLLFQVKCWNKQVPMSKWKEIKRHDGFRILASKVDREPWMVTFKLSDFLKICEDIGLVWNKDLIPPF